MKSKRILAMTLAATMVAGSSLTAFASAPSTVDATKSTVSATADGSISTVEKNVVSIILPTSAAMNFVIDPQGLLGMTGNTATLDSLADSEGLIVGRNAVGIINKSSVPIEMSVQLEVKDSDTSTPTTFVATKDAAVGSGASTTKKMCLYALPSYRNVYTDAADVAGNYGPSTTALTLGTTAKTAVFVLDAADYQVTREGSSIDDYKYDYKLANTANNGVGTALKLGGYVNPKADWSDYSKTSSPSKITVTAVFSYDATKDLSTTAVSNSYGFGWTAANITTNDAALLQLSSRCKTGSATFDKKTGSPADVTMEYELVGDEKLSGVFVLALDGTTWANVLTDPAYSTFVAHDDKTHKFTLKKEFLNYYETGSTVKVWFIFKEDKEGAVDSPVDASAPACTIAITDTTVVAP